MAFALACVRQKLGSKIGQFKIRFSSSASPDKKGLVLGLYTNKDSSEVELTPTADEYNKKLQGKLLSQINLPTSFVGKGNEVNNYMLVHDTNSDMANQ